MRDREVVKHIIELCEERNWSYYKLAKEAGLPSSTLYNLHERTNIPSLPILQLICDAMGITLGEFFFSPTDRISAKQ